MAIANYDIPQIRCDKDPGKGPPWRSCAHIFADMKATTTRQVFGRGSEPRVEVSLPRVLKASMYSPCECHVYVSLVVRSIDHATADARCMIEIGIQGKATTTSWYEIWEAVMAIVAMCVRADKGGKAYRIG